MDYDELDLFASAAVTATYITLFGMIEAKIRGSSYFRQPVPANEKFAVTLRYLQQVRCNVGAIGRCQSANQTDVNSISQYPVVIRP